MIQLPVQVEFRPERGNLRERHSIAEVTGMFEIGAVSDGNTGVTAQERSLRCPMAALVRNRRFAFAMACLIQALVAALLPGSMAAGCCRPAAPSAESSIGGGCHMAMHNRHSVPPHSASTPAASMKHSLSSPSLLREGSLLHVSLLSARTVTATASARDQMSHGSACIDRDVGLQRFLSTYRI